jgi:hypothetical protein
VPINIRHTDANDYVTMECLCCGHIYESTGESAFRQAVYHGLAAYGNTKVMRNYKLERLLKGETFITSEKGNSLVSLIKSGHEHKLAPTKWDQCQKGNIVYCKVDGKFYTDQVKATDVKKGLLIRNNKEGIDSWTKQVYGKVLQIFYPDGSFWVPGWFFKMRIN